LAFDHLQNEILFYRNYLLLTGSENDQYQFVSFSVGTIMFFPDPEVQYVAFTDFNLLWIASNGNFIVEVSVFTLSAQNSANKI
jgi:hypothetical protein